MTEIKVNETYQLKEDQLHFEDEKTRDELKDSGYIGFVRRYDLLGTEGEYVLVLKVLDDLVVVENQANISFYTRISNLKEIELSNEIKLTTYHPKVFGDLEYCTKYDDWCKYLDGEWIVCNLFLDAKIEYYYDDEKEDMVYHKCALCKQHLQQSIREEG